MFISAIDTASKFTRAVHLITRIYGGNLVTPGAATLFFVNESGYAVTCRHVAELLHSAEKINNQYASFRAEKAKLAATGKLKQGLKGLELKYNYTPESILQAKFLFMNLSHNGLIRFRSEMHPTLDLAILQFEGIGNIPKEDCARFIKNSTDIKPGKFLCRLGFPFAEFTNFTYNVQTDDIEWTQNGIIASPQFPIEGMLTRFLSDQNGLYGIEMSTPGLRGQSGGPLFDANGIVCGMQSSTKHLHLGFDMVEKDIIVNNKHKKISDFSFLHLGQCIHADSIKSFLKQHGVQYYEAE